MEKYTKEYFIEKFEAIPDELWCRANLTSVNDKNMHCALGHCGVTLGKNYSYNMTAESKALSKLLKPVQQKIFGYEMPTEEQVVYRINDSAHALGKTPKERILNALKSLS